MMTPLLLAFIVWLQAPPLAEAEVENDSELLVWEEIAGLEAMVRESVNDKSLQFTIFSSDPVRGYYVDRIGVYLIVPVRYRYVRSQIRSEGASISPPNQGNLGLDEQGLDRRVRQWREALQKEAINKEADFEAVILTMKELLPQIADRLNHLPEDENLTLIIEEREPAWSHVGFRLDKKATRKLVTLRVAKQAVSEIHSRETTFPHEWMEQVKRTNSKRPILP